MSDVPSADDLLSTITDFVNDPSQPGTNADRPIRLATIDPAYVPGTGLPKVTFDGEATMSVKAYPYMGAAPRPGSRVALLPVGTRGYLIAGGVVGSTGGSAGAATLSIISNGAFRANQRGYTSGASIPIGTYCLDRWKASGVTNLVPNPSVKTAVGNWIAAGTNGTLTRQTGLTGSPVPGITTYTHTAWTGGSTVGQGGAYAGSASSVVADGRTYALSAWARTNVATTIRLALQTNIGLVVGVDQVIAANTWTRIVDRLSTQPGATTAGVILIAGSAVQFVSGNTLDTLGWLFTQGSILYPVFDGDTTDCSWAGTANASISYNVPNVVPTLTGTFDPNFGQMLTLNTSARVSQIVERSRVPAGGWIAAHDGTAQMRVYDNLTAPGSRPAFQAGPVVFTADGLDDVVVEFSGGVAGATIGRVRMLSGTTDYGFALPTIGDELRDCWRYFLRWASSLAAGGQRFPGTVIITGTTTLEAQIATPVQMRTIPQVLMNNICVTDAVSATSSALTPVLNYWQTFPQVGNVVQFSAAWTTVTFSGGTPRQGMFAMIGAGPSSLALDAELV